MSTGHSGSGGLFAGVWRGGLIGSLFSQQQKQQLQQQQVLDMSEFWDWVQGGTNSSVGETVVGAISDPQGAATDVWTQTVVDFVNDPTVENGVDIYDPFGTNVNPFGVITDGINQVADVPDWLAEDDPVTSTGTAPTPGVPTAAGGPNPNPYTGVDDAQAAVAGGCGCGCTGEDLPFDPKDCADEKVILDSMKKYLDEEQAKNADLENKMCAMKQEKKDREAKVKDVEKKYKKRLDDYIKNCMAVPPPPPTTCPKPPPTSATGVQSGTTSTGTQAGGCGCHAGTQTGGTTSSAGTQTDSKKKTIRCTQAVVDKCCTGPTVPKKRKTTETVPKKTNEKKRKTSTTKGRPCDPKPTKKPKTNA